MTIRNKQPKINKFLHRKVVTSAPGPADGHEPDEELQQLRETLKSKQDELFQLQRQTFKRKVSLPKAKDEEFVQPQRIMYNNSINNLQKELQLMSMLTGMEVQSYVANDHCSIVFHLQHDSQQEVKHGLRINMSNGINEISHSLLPYGFNLNSVLANHDNIIEPDCLRDIRKALVAYHDRLDQYKALEVLLKLEASLRRNVDGTHIEVTFLIRSALDPPDTGISVTLVLDYRLFDTRVKYYSLLEKDIPEDIKEVVMGQCVVFNKKPLVEAFHGAFIDGVGPYVMDRQFSKQAESEVRRRRRGRRAGPDDTFRPEDCSNSDDDAD